MQHPMIKLAAAAAIVMTVILGWDIVGGPSNAHVAWGRVLQTVETVPAVVFHMTNVTTFGENSNRTTESTVYDAGRHGSRIDTYINGELFFQKFLLLDKRLACSIRFDDKTYLRTTLPENYGAEAQGDTPRYWVKTILSENYTELGRQTIDGIACEGVEVRNSQLLTGNEGTIRLWVDIASNLPVRIELETIGMEAGRKWPMQFIMNDFQWDIELAEGTFEPRIPDDFTPREEPKAGATQQRPQREAAPSRPLTEQEQAQQPQVKEAVRQFFQACHAGDWDQICHWGLGFERFSTEQRTSILQRLSELELSEVGEPFKTETDGDVWHVPCQIRWKVGPPQGKEIRVRYSEALGRFLVSGGL